MTVYFYFDTDGYYLGNGTAQKENSTETEPSFKFGYWQKWNGEKWVNKKIADSAKDLENITIPDISFEDVTATNHEKELYALFQKFLDDAHYIEKDETEKTLTFKAYTPEEITEKEALEQEQVNQQEFEQALADLKDRMATANLLGDDEWKAELRAEYLELMEEE